MAKCPICNSRKGKRQCLVVGYPICSKCCGVTRNPGLCMECQFYQKPKRNYIDVPAYSTAEMSNDMDLQISSYAIEGALCAYDVDNGSKLKDSDAIRIIELLIDVRHFGDQQPEAESLIIANGFRYIEAVIRNDLQEVSNEEIVKILAVIWFVARRRTRIAREYMNFIHQYAGQRVGPGIRLMGNENQ